MIILSSVSLIILLYICNVYIVLLYLYILFILHIEFKERKRMEGESEMFHMLKDNREFKAKNKSWIPNYDVTMFLNL